MSRTYIIAEAGVNHNDRLDLAYKLCDEAKEAGADCVKFQTWQTEKIVTQNAKKATYQSENTHNKGESQFDMLKKLELSYHDFELLQKHCHDIGIDFISTPDEEYSLSFLMTLRFLVWISFIHVAFSPPEISIAIVFLSGINLPMVSK